jgi:hypothetical protein
VGDAGGGAPRGRGARGACRCAQPHGVSAPAAPSPRPRSTSPSPLLPRPPPAPQELQFENLETGAPETEPRRRCCT